MRGPVVARCRRKGCIQDALLHSGLCSSHTRAVTRARRNTSDGVRTGPKKKLTPEQVVELRRMRVNFRTTVEIGRHFGIDPSTVLSYLNAPRSVVEAAAGVPVPSETEAPSSAVSAAGWRERSNAGSDPDARAVSVPARPNSPGVIPPR